MKNNLKLNDLHVGSIYRWVPSDYRSWVPWFNVPPAPIAADRPRADMVVMYLGMERFADNVIPAYIFLAGEKKYAVWNNDVIHGLQPIKG
jgi:hypothetical protein